MLVAHNGTYMGGPPPRLTIQGCLLRIEVRNEACGVRHFRTRVRVDVERDLKVGHELVDEFLEFASGRVRPGSVWTMAHYVHVFELIRKKPTDVSSKTRHADSYCSSPVDAAA